MTDSKKVQQLTLAGFLITVCGAIFFSTKAIIVKLAFKDTGVDAVTLLALRMLFSLPFYAVAAYLALRKTNAKKLTTKMWLNIIGLGCLGYYLSSLFDFIGLQYISAGLERLILFLYPTFAVLINVFVFKTKLHKLQIMALCLTYLGIGIAYFDEMQIAGLSSNFLYGSFMVFLCAVTYSIYLVGTGKMVPVAGVTRYTSFAMLAATAGVLLHFIFTHSITSVHFSSSLMGYSSALAIVATVLPSFMISNGMKKIGSTNVAIITSIGPVSTILQAHFILHEPLTLLQVTGTTLVIIGVFLIGYKSREL
jgi:drug/metabolite transporter (DMT)-like permease